MKRLAPLMLAVLAGCSTDQIAGTLSTSGVAAPQAQMVASDLVAAGTLFCQYGPTIAAVSGVKVNKASAAALAAGCSAISVAGVAQPYAVPVSPPADARLVPVATVPTPVAVAVTASVPGATTR